MREKTNYLRKLKAKVLIFAVTALSMSFTVAAQEAHINLPIKRLTAEEVFSQIQLQTSYKIAVNNSLSDKLSIKIAKSPIAVNTLLKQLLNDSGLTYRVDGNFIIIIEDTAKGKMAKKDVVKKEKETTPESTITPDWILTKKSPETTDRNNPDEAVPSKATAYFVPNSENYNLLPEETKTKFSFVPATHIYDNKYLPKTAVKTNLLYLATTTPNLAIEFGIARKWTIDIAAGLNPWDLNSRKGGIRHGLVQPELRYWFCNRFEKHFVGLHGIYGQYEIADIDLAPFGNDLTGIRYNGWGAGGGISYGYHLPMGKRWGWEFTVGVGYIYLDYKKYSCGECDDLIKKQSKHYFGPTKAGISLIYMIK